MSKSDNHNAKAPAGTILVINTGSTTTKFAVFRDGKSAFEKKLDHAAEELAAFSDVMQQDKMRAEAILSALREAGIGLDEIDLIMARGGLFVPCVAGVYSVNPEMREVLVSCRDGKHACNLSALIGEEIAARVNALRKAQGITPRFGLCEAYIADAPMADEMIPECRITGVPEFQRTSILHTLNSRAIMRRYLRETGRKAEETTAIVCHMGGGISISLHSKGRVIDTTNALGGDGPITPERAGGCPPFPLVDMCFSGKYTKEEIKKKLVGRGGAVAWFGTNDMRLVEQRAAEGKEEYVLFMKAFVLNISKFIAALATVVNGKVDAILITGGIAHSKTVTSGITERVNWIAPVKVYPGEDELEALAENGYLILSGEARIHTYNKDRVIED